MATVQFIALRSLYNASSGDTVTYELPIKYGGMSRTVQVFSTSRRSLAGRRETYYESRERTYAIESKPLFEEELFRLRMFLDSLEEGESCLFAESPSAQFETAYVDPGYEEARHPARDTMRVVAFRLVVP